MANPLPILRGTNGGLNGQVLYPFTRTVTCRTNVQTFWNAMEQRSVAASPLYSFELPMQLLADSDRLLWQTPLNTGTPFFQRVKGRFSSDLSITMQDVTIINPDGSTDVTTITYSNLSLDDDDLHQVNTTGLTYDQRVRLRQVSNYPFTVPEVTGIYPRLYFGQGLSVSVAEKPFTQTTTIRNTGNDNIYGPQYTRCWYGDPIDFPNFPGGTGSGGTGTATVVGGQVTMIDIVTVGHGYVSSPIVKITGDGVGAKYIVYVDGSGHLSAFVPLNYGSGYTTASVSIVVVPYLKSWILSYPILVDVDMALIEQFFLGQQGRMGTFAFTDPIDGVTYPNVRFDQDDLAIHYITKNQSSTEVRLRQTFSVNNN